MSVSDAAKKFVFDIHGTRKDPYDTSPPLISRASIRVSPRLCEGAYRLAFVFTPVRGDIMRFPYPVRVRNARLDGKPRRCPLAGLPRRGLRSMRVQITIDGNRLMAFSAKPSTRAGNTFKPLNVPELSMYRFTARGGVVSVRIAARYSGAGRTIAFLADTKAPR